MLSGQLTSPLKESIKLRDVDASLDFDGAYTNAVLFGGTKVLRCARESLRVRPMVILLRPALALRKGSSSAHDESAPTTSSLSSSVGSFSFRYLCKLVYKGERD